MQTSGDDDDDDAEWERFQNKMSKREKALEGKSKVSHPTHCPLFPDVSTEFLETKSFMECSLVIVIVSFLCYH